MPVGTNPPPTTGVLAPELQRFLRDPGVAYNPEFGAFALNNATPFYYLALEIDEESCLRWFHCTPTEALKGGHLALPIDEDAAGVLLGGRAHDAGLIEFEGTTYGLIQESSVPGQGSVGLVELRLEPAPSDR